MEVSFIHMRLKNLSSEKFYVIFTISVKNVSKNHQMKLHTLSTFICIPEIELSSSLKYPERKSFIHLILSLHQWQCVPWNFFMHCLPESTTYV